MTPAEQEQAALDELTDAIRFALGGPHSHEEIAGRLGVSTEWVRDLEKRAMGKLRRAAMRRRLSFRD